VPTVAAPIAFPQPVVAAVVFQAESDVVGPRFPPYFLPYALAPPTHG